MNDWFEWNGVKCTLLGIHVSEHPPITLPEERVTFNRMVEEAREAHSEDPNEENDFMVRGGTLTIEF